MRSGPLGLLSSCAIRYLRRCAMPQGLQCAKGRKIHIPRRPQPAPGCRAWLRLANPGEQADRSHGLFELTEEQRAFQATARQFARDEMMPQARDWDENEIFPVEALAQGGGARLRRHLRQGRRRRLGADAARRRADLRGTGAGLHLDRRLYLDPQHGGLDDRRLRRRRGAPEIPAQALHHGAFRQLLPDRAGFRLRRREPDDARACATASITCSTAPRPSSPAAASPTSTS